MSSEDLKLYALPTSPYSKKVLFAAHLWQLPMVVQPVNPFIAEQREAFNQLYPLGKLPCLFHGDQRIAESTVVVEYLQSLAKGPHLIPASPTDAVTVRYWDRVVDNYITAPALEILMNKLMGRELPAGRVKSLMGRLTRVYESLEATLADGAELLTGGTLAEGTLTLADVALLTALPVAENLIPVAQYPNLQTYQRCHQDHPSLIHVGAAAQEYMTSFLESVKAAA